MNGRPSFVMALSMTLLLVTGCNVSVPGTVIGSGNSASQVSVDTDAAGQVIQN